MLDLEQDERHEILEAFQRVMAHLQEESDIRTLRALAVLADGKFTEGVAKADEAVVFDKLLTDIRSYLSLEYRKVASLH